MVEDEPTDEDAKIGIVPNEREVTQRSYLSLTHIRSGALFARKAGAIEEQYREEDWANDREERNRRSTKHDSYVTSSIITTFSFLEASINELLTDILNNNSAIEDLDSNFKSNVRNVSQNHDILNKPTLEQYQISLLLADKNLFETGEQPYQDVGHLKILRNKLVHYVPEDIQVQPEPENPDVKIGGTLQTKNFDLNPFSRENSAFYPNKCLSHGCASWAVESTLKFTDEFYSRLGFDPIYEIIRDELRTDLE